MIEFLQVVAAPENKLNCASGDNSRNFKKVQAVTVNRVTCRVQCASSYDGIIALMNLDPKRRSVDDHKNEFLCLFTFVTIRLAAQ